MRQLSPHGFARFVTGSIAAVLVAGAAHAQSGISTISSNFNGTAIAGGDTIWFSSVFKVNGSVASGTILDLVDSSISFKVGATNYSVAVPNEAITFGGTGATTTWNGSSWVGMFQTSGISGNNFLSGVALTVPSGGLPGGINPVTWTGKFESNEAISVNWQWAAAVYTAFNSNYADLGVKATDDNHFPPFNSDHAGTPENYKQYVTGGARGGGGSNYTGSYSGTATVTPAPVPEPATLLGMGLGSLLLIRRRNSKQNWPSRKALTQ